LKVLEGIELDEKRKAGRKERKGEGVRTKEEREVAECKRPRSRIR
jgi:hypothetical protein